MSNFEKQYLGGSLNILNLFKCLKYKIDFKKENPTYFDPEGLLIFCGPQGSGKTLSAVQYVCKVMSDYDYCILVTNVSINDIPFTHTYSYEYDILYLIDIFTGEKILYKDLLVSRRNNEELQRIVIEYDGLTSLKVFENGYEGIIYFIDEIQLEWNSLESKNISIEEMVEFAQQRKQRKHIVGTSQIYGRLAKPLREQIKNVVLCKNYFGLIQFNNLIDGFATVEKDGHIETESVKRFIWFHSPDLYSCYDTYAKMKRYKKEWNGHKRSDNL